MQENNNPEQCITWEDFAKIDLRVGTIIKAEINQKAKKPAYKIWVDLGELGVKCSSGQFTKLYQPQDLIGRQALCVVNFPIKKIAGFPSEILVTGLDAGDEGIALAVSDKKVPNGSKLC